MGLHLCYCWTTKQECSHERSSIWKQPPQESLSRTQFCWVVVNSTTRIYIASLGIMGINCVLYKRLQLRSFCTRLTTEFIHGTKVQLHIWFWAHNIHHLLHRASKTGSYSLGQQYGKQMGQVGSNRVAKPVLLIFSTRKVVAYRVVPSHGPEASPAAGSVWACYVRMQRGSHPCRRPRPCYDSMQWN